MKRLRLSFYLLLTGICLNAFCGSFFLSPALFKQQLSKDKKAILLDIRTPEQFRNAYLPQARNIDWLGNFEDYVQEIDTAKAIYLYGLNDSQCLSAVQLLQYKGFRKVFALKGGLYAWQKSGFPLVRPAKDPHGGISINDYQKLIRSDRLVLIDFNAPWCKPCKILSPILDSVAEAIKPILGLYKFDIDQNRILATYMKVYSLPLIILYKNGKEVWRKEELISKETLISVISQYRN